MSQPVTQPDSSRVPSFVFVTGGVSSALGKGITAASLGRLLTARGLRVTMQKLDPYLNVDPGTMNPFEHGEVFVTDDGGETDLDLGHYERFVDRSLHRGSSISSGQIWWSVITKERRGDYLGKTVQVIPHVTDEIKSRIHAVAEDTDVVIVEVGGTVGDIEGLPFLEAIRQFRHDVGRDNICYIHCALVPFIAAAGELKTKPAQHSVRELRAVGIQPDVLVLRADRELDGGLKRKIALQCDVDLDAVVAAVDRSSLYEVPLAMRAEGLDTVVMKRLGLPASEPDLTEWQALVDRVHGARDTATVAIVGKYVELPDAYLSVVEALRHGGIANGVNVELRWIASDDLTPTDAHGEGADASRAEHRLAGVDGVLIPGGFGIRGVEGKIAAIRWAREHQVPFLGLCLGLQSAVIEFARHVVGLTDAHSAEFEPGTPHPVIDLMADQRDVADKGGTMRLGAYPAKLAAGTRTRAAYGDEPVVYERHRHRYEVNNRYRAELEAGGMVFSGVSPDDRLVEFIELPDHPWFVATQAHPELKSRPIRPHPLFDGFVRAARQHGREAEGRLPVELDEPTAGELVDALGADQDVIALDRP
ncbi:CTP synthase [Nitriliruptor alkaliphilus]|uniref:CTP synthase n=1 Tax=Nitriliruptor alkaliphilus TaxID=427918 RepID=UPI003CCBB1EC